MSPLAVRVVFLSCACVASAGAWTIDLPDARKYYFEKADEMRKKQEAIKYNREQSFFDNIMADSPHNRDEQAHGHGHEREHENDVYEGKYAEDYEYMSYMEKKVHDIVHNGSAYLEGLRRALDRYGEELKGCRALNLTAPQTNNGTWLPENTPPLFSLNNTSNQPGSTSNQPGFIGGQPGSTSNQPGFIGSQPGSTSNQPGFIGSQPGSTSNQPGFIGGQPGLPNRTNIQNGTFNGTVFPTSLNSSRCAEATRRSEHVRRLAELALWATSELQDQVYGQEHGQHHDEEAEAEQLIRLAYFLDRLAVHTGFEPRPQDHTTSPQDYTTTTPQPTMFSVMGDIPASLARQMAECLDPGAAEPATERCRYPLDYPPFLKRLFNLTDSPNGTTTERTQKNVYTESLKYGEDFLINRRKRDASTTQNEKEERIEGSDIRDKRGILVNAVVGQKLVHKVLEGVEEDLHREHFHPEHFHHRPRLAKGLAILKNSHKKLVEVVAAIQHRRLGKTLEEYHEQPGWEKIKSGDRRKRSVEKPIVNVMKYFVKHKVWVNSNQENPGDIDIANHLSNVDVVPDEYGSAITKTDIVKVHKRSIDNKKYEHMKFPENPFQDLSNYVKHKNGVNYINDEDQKEKLRRYMDDIEHDRSSTAETNAQKLLKREKRSVHYEKKLLPSQSEDPSKDISYYVKNLEGTEYEPSAVQAAQVRGNLELTFQSPNIEVVRRYGANVNPAIPYPFGYGLFQTFFGDI